MDDWIKKTEGWYDDSYASSSFRAQRLYPNEELLRFLGRTFFSKIDRKERRGIKILEIGCGSCPNLWMIGKEGFNAYGIDLSSEAIELGKQMLDNWQTAAELKVASMTEILYPNGFFDVVVDVFSSYCLPEKEFKQCLDEVSRVLRPGGQYFTYTPSNASNAFIDPGLAKHIDKYTLEGIVRESSPYSGNRYPFRFEESEHLKGLLKERGFQIDYLEKTGRTSRWSEEYFEFISLVATKLD